MQKRFIYYALLVFAFIVIALISLLMREKGIPEIQDSIDHQLSDLVSESPSMKGLAVGRENGIHTAIYSSYIKGWFQYNAELNGSPVDLLVYWEGNSTNNHITKIEWATTYTEPKMIWPTNQ